MPPIGDAIREARISRGLTQDSLAELASVTGGTINRVERDKDASMHARTVLQVATALHLVMVLTVEELGAFAAAAKMEPQALFKRIESHRQNRAEASHPRKDLYDLADQLADRAGLVEARLTLERLVDMADAVADAPLRGNQSTDMLVHRSETELPAEGNEPAKRVTILSPHRRAEPKPRDQRQRREGAN